MSNYWTIVHELGHVWDFESNQKLRKELVEKTGGGTVDPKDPSYSYPSWCIQWSQTDDYELPGCNKYGYYYGGVPPVTSGKGFNSGQDFAESVAAYVYPGIAWGRVDKQLSGYKKKYTKLGLPEVYLLYRHYLYYDDFRKTTRGQFIAEEMSK